MAMKRRTVILFLLAAIALGCASLALGLFKSTPPEQLAQATVKGTEASGHYPYCAEDSLAKPGHCNDLQRLDPDYYVSQNWPWENKQISIDGSTLNIGQLVSPRGRDAFLNSISIAPNGHPVAVGGPSLLIASTSNAAQTWHVQTFSRFADALRDVAFSQDSTGFAVGNNGIILRSQDAGQTWHVYNETYNTPDAPALQSKIEGEAYAVSFADNNTAISGGNAHMVRTTDAGQHWRSVPPDFNSQAIQDIAFSDANNGWAIGTGGMVFRTQDQGASWHAVTIASPDTMLMGLDFIDNYGCMAGSWQVWCTTDGGESWVKSHIDLPAGAKENNGHDITRLKLANTQQGWFTTNKGHIYQTRDGGKTWQLWFNINNSEYVAEAEIWGLAIAEDTVWAVGSGRFPGKHGNATEPVTPMLPFAPLVLSWPTKH